MVRGVVLLVPLVMSFVAAIVCNRLFNRSGLPISMPLRIFVLCVVATAVLWAVDKLARRLLPLAALLHLSLVFPDQAPSRFRSALRSGSSRRLERMLEEARTNGLAPDPGHAARQVVEMIGAIGDHDRRTRGHCERVRLYADLVGEELNLSPEERQKLQWGALLHDLGKLMVPAEILNKKGRPDEKEWAIIERHPSNGMRLITPMADFLGEWAHAIGGHHERWDGEGYPNRLRGNDISLAAAIVAVADSFEVMTAVRSYKKAMSLAAARAELTRCAGSHFSPEVVRAFLSISLRRLRLVAGPLTALTQIRWFGSSANTPAAGSAIGMGVASAAGGSGAAGGAFAAVAVPVVAAVATLGAAMAFIIPMANKISQGPEKQRVTTEIGGVSPAADTGSGSSDAGAVPSAPPATTPPQAGGRTGSRSTSGTVGSASHGSTAPRTPSAPQSSAPAGAATMPPATAAPPTTAPPAAPSPTTPPAGGESDSAGSGGGSTSGSPATVPPTTAAPAGDRDWYWHHHHSGHG
jgi:HD-GYP domain-containing protein (c-di-GMP phosphodiesterase class II)